MKILRPLKKSNIHEPNRIKRLYHLRVDLSPLRHHKKIIPVAPLPLPPFPSVIIKSATISKILKSNHVGAKWVLELLHICCITAISSLQKGTKWLKKSGLQ